MSECAPWKISNEQNPLRWPRIARKAQFSIITGYATYSASSQMQGSHVSSYFHKNSTVIIMRWLNPLTNTFVSSCSKCDSKNSPARPQRHIPKLWSSLEIHI